MEFCEKYTKKTWNFVIFKPKYLGFCEKQVSLQTK